MDTFYKDNLAMHGGKAEGNGWDNSAYEKTIDRYNIILNMIPDRNIYASLCELGFGNGFGIRHINSRFSLNNYIGYDSCNEYVEFCKEEHLNFKTQFNLGTIKELDSNPDWIFSVGVYTYKAGISNADYYSMFISDMKLMYDKCKKGFLINGFTDQVSFEDTKLYYHNILELIELVIAKLGGKFEIKCKTVDNVPYEFFLMVLK